MAIELHIFLHGARVPSRDAWQEVIQQLGFPTVLDPTFDVQHEKGFRPATYKGYATGFEFYLERAAEILVSGYEHVAERTGDRDVCATFRWGGRFNEMAAAITAAAALAKLTDGIYFYPEDGAICGAEDAVKNTRRDVS